MDAEIELVKKMLDTLPQMSDYHIRNRAGKLGDGLDIKGMGGYAIVPPSVHRSGRSYEWPKPNAPIASAPAWLLDLLDCPAQSMPCVPASGIGILTEGKRNDGLFRYGCALRRRGGTQAEIEAELLAANARRCRPPLSNQEVQKIAASAAKYPVGGLDPLETAWQATQKEIYSSHYEQFLGLCRHLQLARLALTIALPLKRIGGLMDCDWTQVRRWRNRALREGRLRLMERYVAHRRAGHYSYIECPTSADVPLGANVPLTITTCGLVGHPKAESPSGTPREHKADAPGYVEGWL